MQSRREIRYRVWDKSRKCWVYWDDLAVSPVTPAENYDDGYIWEANGPDGKLGSADYADTEEEAEQINLPVNPYIFQLSTYAKDKNGKEMFEGDIVRLPSFYTHSLIGVINIGFNGLSVIFPSGRGPTIYWDMVEVIGNIFENEELLCKEDFYSTPPA